MTSATQRSRAGDGGFRPVLLRGLLAIALLLPIGTLFQALWRADSDRLSVVDQERHGIQYVVALGSLTTALVNAESTVVTGGSVPGGALTEAIQGVAAVDARVGNELGTTERWNDLRDGIQALAGRPAGDRVGAYQAYVDVTDLLLALYGKVSDASHLAQDSSADAYLLQNAVSDKLPLTIIGLGRLADLAALAPGRPADEEVETAAALLAGRDTVIGAADALTEDFLLTVAITDSRTMSKTMLSDIDAFRLVTDKLEASHALVDGKVTAADVAEADRLRTEGLTTGAALLEAVESELDRIVVARRDSITRERDITLAAGVLGLLAALTPLLLGIIGRRPARRWPSSVEPPDSGATAAEAPPRSVNHQRLVSVGGREPSGATR